MCLAEEINTCAFHMLLISLVQEKALKDSLYGTFLIQDHKASRAGPLLHPDVWLYKHLNLLWLRIYAKAGVVV